MVKGESFRVYGFRALGFKASGCCFRVLSGFIRVAYGLYNVMF